MKSTLRSRIAAAALLLSPVAALVAQPAQAQLSDVLPGLIAQVVMSDAHRGEGWRDGWRRDERAPQIMDLTPQPGDRTDARRRTTVSARFRDNFSGVDPASVRLRIDGNDVTHAAHVDGDEVRFRDELRPGRHVAEVIVRDRAGNTARRSWQFQVSSRGWGDDRHGGGHGRDR
jgi:hypothetical protein